MPVDTVGPFFNNNPLAEDVVFTASGGTAKTIKAIFDAPFQLTAVQGIQYQNSNPMAHVKTGDVAGVDDAATLVRNGVTYHVTSAEPDGTGITTLILSTQAPA